MKIFNSIWLVLGAPIMMLGALSLLTLVYIFKFFKFGIRLPKRFKENIFVNSKAHPHPPSMEKY